MKIEEKFVARLSVHSIPVTDARNEETMHGFARRIEATPPGQCALALQLSLLEASALQTCGKCVPCRDGLPQLAKLMRRIVDCEAQPEDLGRLKTLAEFIRLGSDCAIGYDAAQMVLESLTRFADEFKHHTEEQSCQKGIAQSVPCETFCPAHVDVPGYIALVAEGRTMRPGAGGPRRESRCSDPQRQSFSDCLRLCVRASLRKALPPHAH